MSEPNKRSPDGRLPADMARIDQRMRFEDRAVLTMIISMVLGTAVTFVLASVGLTKLLLPVGSVFAVVAIGAAIAWVIGDVRTEKAFGRIRTQPRPRQPFWKYGAAIGAALIAGAAYALFPQYGRWIWLAFIVVGTIGFVWVQVRRRRRT